MIIIRTDWANLQDYDRVILFPRDGNPLQREPDRALFTSGYFYLEGRSPHEVGPDYYLGDVARYCEGFLLDN